MEDESTEEAGATAHVGTSVRLVRFKPDYQSWSPRSAETIAKRMVEHCLEMTQSLGFSRSRRPGRQVPSRDAHACELV